jgi:RNA polymerase sigma-70 factor, ECF subfamily
MQIERGDEELAGRLRGGEPAALAEVFARHRQRLWHIVRFRLSHQLAGRVDPDDVLQEVYLAAVQRLHHFAECSMSPFLWLRSIVGQTMIDLHRHHAGALRRQAGREVPLQGQAGLADTALSMASLLAGNLTSPTQAVARAEMMEQVRQALQQMDEIDREVLALRHFEELTNSEVAEALGIQPKAASIRYIRALARLKTILAPFPQVLTEMRHG